MPDPVRELVDERRRVRFAGGSSLRELDRIENGAVVRRLDAAQLLRSERLDLAGQPVQRLEHLARIALRERLELLEVEAARIDVAGRRRGPRSCPPGSWSSMAGRRT